MDLGDSLKIVIEKASLNNSFGYFGDDRKMGNQTVVVDVFSIDRGFFFRSGVTVEDVSGMERCLLKEKGWQQWRWWVRMRNLTLNVYSIIVFDGNNFTYLQKLQQYF